MKKILNIILGVLLAVMAVLGIYAIATGGSEASISLNLIWCYVLLALAIASAIFCAIFGMIQNPAGVKGTLLSFALIVVVVLVSYFIATSHDTVIPDFASGGVFPVLDSCDSFHNTVSFQGLCSSWSLQSVTQSAQINEIPTVLFGTESPHSLKNRR